MASPPTRHAHPTQAILFKDGKSLGKLVNARLCLTPLAGAHSREVDLQYSHWQPVGKQGTGVEPLAIEVDEPFRRSAFEGRVLGRVQAQPFHSSTFVSGQAVAAAVSQHFQRLEYVERHRQGFHGGSGPCLGGQQSKYLFATGEHAVFCCAHINALLHAQVSD